MNPAMNVYLHRLMHQAESEANSNIVRLQSARTLREVVSLTDVHLAPEIRAIKHTIAALRHLEHAAERRADALVKEHLRELSERTGTEREQCMRRYQREDWPLLRGNFPRLAMHVERQARAFKTTEGEPT